MNINANDNHVIEFPRLSGENALDTWATEVLEENLMIYENSLYEATHHILNPDSAAIWAFRVAQIKSEIARRSAQ